jgi:hypothetical protein
MDGTYAEWIQTLAQAQEGQLSGRLPEGVWLVLAALAGSGFTTLGAVVSDFLAGRREDRRAEHEAKRQQDQWEREDRIRKEEREQQAEAEQQERRVRAYKAFVAATPFDVVAPENAWELLSTLDEAFVEVQMYASDWVAQPAGTFYQSARTVLESPPQDEEHNEQRMRDLRSARAEFWKEVRDEAEATSTGD